MDRNLLSEPASQHPPQFNHLDFLLQDGVEKWNHWRSQHPQERPDFSRIRLGAANLNGADLSEVMLTRANLQRANLQKANLMRANLAGTNLKGANLSGANLQNATLKWANLTRANLRRANLRGVNLSGADLSGADLSGADLSGAMLTETKLTEATLPNGLRYGTHPEGSVPQISLATLSDSPRGASCLLTEAPQSTLREQAPVPPYSRGEALIKLNAQEIKASFLSEPGLN